MHNNFIATLKIVKQVAIQTVVLLHSAFHWSGAIFSIGAAVAVGATIPTVTLLRNLSCT